MVAGDRTGAGPPAPAPPSLPPVQPVGLAAMILVVIGGIYVAGGMPNARLAPALALLVVSAALLAVAVGMLARQRAFAWGTFFLVGRWALLAYVVIAGMLEYVFALDGTPARVMVVLTLMLIVFAVDIPLMLAFSVARYQQPDGSSNTPAA